MVTYKYNGRTVYRVYTSGGYIETTSVTEARKIEKRYSYLTQIAGGFLPAHLRKQGTA